jgi:hypothetical protein
LSVTLNDARDSACVAIDVDDATDNNLGVHSIAELLATRLSFPTTSKQMTTMPPQKPLIPYLAQAHRKASDELKSLCQTSNSTKSSSSSSSSKTGTSSSLQSILEEIQRQVVSYAASLLMEPDLFEQAKDGTEQLGKAILAIPDPTQSVFFGVLGSTSSFYYLLCEELYQQDETTLHTMVGQAVTQIMTQLKACDSLDSGGGDTSALALVAALTSVCAHKKASLAVTELLHQFLLPAAGTPAAAGNKN